MKNNKGQMKTIVWGIIALLVIMVLMMTVYIVPAGKRGVLLTFGKPSMDAVEEGLHFKIPFAQTVKKMEVRTTKIEAQAASVSKDLQDVDTTLVLNYQLSPGEVPVLYQKIGRAYEERIISPAIQESLKAVMARFTAEELITKRSEVSTGIKNFLSERLRKYWIVVDDFNIVNLQFSDEFSKAIEEKVTAVQRKLKAERDLERIEIEKLQRIAQAEGEAEALRLQKEHITPNLIKQKELEVRRFALEVQQEAIAKWNGALPTITGGAIPFINMDLKDMVRTGGTFS